MVLVINFTETFSNEDIATIQEAQKSIEEERTRDDFEYWVLVGDDQKYPQSLDCGMSYHDVQISD